MKHKVSELEGALLDAAAAKANGLKWAVTRAFHGETHKIETPPFCIAQLHDTFHALTGTMRPYNPSTDWRFGGEIIERDRVSVEYGLGDWCASPYGCEAIQYGPTPLIAAMRAYVASKFGDEVEL